jgi:methionyl-tRNA formyltransferase
MSPVLDLAFMGTPDFAVPILARLLAAGHRVRAVYTQPPRPSGRGHQVHPSPVHALAAAENLPVRCPESLSAPETLAEFAALRLDAAIVAAYGLILPPAMLAAPRRGCLNVHASLLPRWRGAAPIQRALMAGDGATGITIMQMEEGLDSGPILLQQKVPIGPETRADALTAELAELGGTLILAALDRIATLEPRVQPASGVTYAKKLGRFEGAIDWRLPAAAIERQVRALAPSPGAFFSTGGQRIRVHRAVVADPADSGVAPGTVLDAALAVACGEGTLRPLVLQRPGGTAQEAASFLRGYKLPPGTVLPCPDTA